MNKLAADIDQFGALALDAVHSCQREARMLREENRKLRTENRDLADEKERLGQNLALAHLEIERLRAGGV